MKSDKNIREGYKKSAVGVIPEEWEEVKLGSVSNIKSSKRVLQKDWISQGVPFYRTREIISLANNKQFNTPIFISKELFSELSEKYGIPKVGDILVTGVGTIGETYIVKESDEFYFKDGNVLWIEISDKIDSHFLHYSFKTRYIRKQLMDNASITTVATFTISGAKDTNILLPSIEEQKAIVNILTTWDSGIEKLTQLIAAKREQKKGLMQQLLTGKKRLDGFVGEWKRKKFSEFSNVVRGGSPRPINEYITTNDNGLNWLRIGDIDEDSKFIYSTEEKIKIEGLNKTRLIKKGELILSNSMSFGRPFILKTECCIHDGWLAITEISDSVDREFLYYLISEDKIQSRFEHLAAGSGVRNLNKELISNFLIKLPPYDEQKAIAKILDTADQEIIILEEKLAAMKEEKKGLMQVLLTGEKRLIERKI